MSTMAAQWVAISTKTVRGSFAVRHGARCRHPRPVPEWAYSENGIVGAGLVGDQVGDKAQLDHLWHNNCGIAQQPNA
jgi:hypothetical protein